tara:strand:+ start:6529 stop:9240 length:2712 start_codon:yes stop_codon:yes gene_type:complete
VAKLKAYKFVNPGVSKVVSPSVAAARKHTFALNRLGSTISGIGSVVKDIENISIAQIKNDKLRERTERRRQRREADLAQEELIENKKQAKKKKPKLTNAALKIATGSLGWIEKFLAPIGQFLLYLGQLAITKEVLDWVSDENNQKKLADFLEKTHFVFSKLFGWASGFTNNILDGFSALSDPNSTFIQRLGAVGTIMKGFIGLKYLMNPFSLIGDILSLIDLLTGTGGNKRGPKGRGRKSRPGTRFRPKITTSGGKSTGPFRGIREFFRNTRKFLGKKTEITVSGGKKGNFFTNLFKGKTKVTTGGAKTGNFFTNLFKGNKVTKGTGGVKGNFFSNLFKGKADPTKVTTGQGGVKGNFFSNLFKGSGVTKGTGGKSLNFFQKLLGKAKSVKVSPAGVAKGVAGGLAFTAADMAANALVDEVINKPLGKLIDKKAQQKVEERFLRDGSAKAREYYQNIINEESKKKPINFWANLATLGYGSIFVGPKTYKIDSATKALNYLDQITFSSNNSGLSTGEDGTLKITVIGNREKKKTDLQKIFEEPKKKTNWWSGLFSKNKPKKTKTEQKKKKGLFGLGFLGLEDGGELHEPQEMFIGGLVKGIGRAIGGVAKGIGSAVSGVVKTVGSLAQNPIIGTALSFIPGMQIPMAVINAGTALSQGNIMGALSAGIGGLGAFANINTVNAISQPQWLQNLRFSGFGQGVANMYHSGLNAFNNLSAGFNNIMNSKVGSIAQDILGGNYLGALSTINPKIGNIATNILNGDYGSALSAFNPEIGAAVTRGMALVDSFRQDPMGLIAGIAEQNGMGGLLKAVTGLMSGADKMTAITQIASEMGIDPRVLGVVKKAHQQALSEGGMSAQFAMDQAMEFIPIPVIIEKIVPIPEAISINSGGVVITASPSSILERMK